MAYLWTTLCAALMVTAATSKPVYLNQGENSSSESTESNSTEETDAHVEPSQDPLQTANTETQVPNTIGVTDPLHTAEPLPTADSGPAAMLNTTALPSPEEAQTSTDPLQLLPVDPSQTIPGTDISQDVPQDSIHTDTVHVLPDKEASLQPGITETDANIGTTQTQVIATTTYQGFPQGATPPLPSHIKPTHPPISSTPFLPIHIGAALTGVPVCFTFQFKSPEPVEPRGDI